ncbi:MAG: hypothetical protein JKY48_18890 [Flavobacteriales bacterium]|nr:hypothetical protein [Flavobacteriales bacterium]
MSISLIGLITFQAYWISHTVQREIESFDRDMQQVLNTVAEEVLKEEAKLLVRKANVQTRSTFIRGSLANDIRLIIKDPTEIDLDRFNNRTVVVTTDNCKTTITTTSTTKSTSTTVITDGIVERYENQKGILSEVVEDIAFQYAIDDANLADRLENISVDTLIQLALENSGFKSIEYIYLLRDTDSNTIVKKGGKLSTDSSLTHYITPLSNDGELNFGVQKQTTSCSKIIVVNPCTFFHSYSYSNWHFHLYHQFYSKAEKNLHHESRFH